MPRWRQALTIVESLLLLAITTVALSVVVQAVGLSQSEMAVYFVTKGGFAVVLATVFSVRQGWRNCGFLGGLRLRYWPYLLPLWVGAAVSVIQGLAATTPLEISAWIAISIAVAFGEEGLYRGIILDTLRPNGNRTAVIISSILFGLSHFIGFIEIDYRYVLGQAFFATGLGLALGWVRLSSTSIWPCVIAHAVLNAAGLLAANGVKEAFEYSVPGMIWIVAFGAISVSWGSYLLWKKSGAMAGPAKGLAISDLV